MTRRDNREFVTYSSLSTFRNCRKRFDYRYNQRLRPIESNRTLHYGSVWHNCLEQLYLLQRDGERTPDSERGLLAIIDEAYPNRDADPIEKKHWHHLRAMFLAYIELFRDDDAKMEIIAVEQEFEAPMLGARAKAKNGAWKGNPKYWMRGKADGVVKIDGQFWLLEHKTTSALSGDYIDRLPLDTQIQLYSLFLEKAYDWPIVGILYNVAVKASLKQKEGETEEEYQARREELIAKSKSGKTSAKRKMPESDEEYHIRLLTKYREDGMFHREQLFLCREDLEILEEEMRELHTAIRTTAKTGRYYRNTDHCFQIGRKCPFVPLCKSKDNPLIREKFFTQSDTAHPELSSPDGDDAESVF